MLSGWADEVVTKSIEKMNSTKAAGGDAAKFSLVDKLAREYQNPTQIREVMMDIFMVSVPICATVEE